MIIGTIPTGQPEIVEHGLKLLEFVMNAFLCRSEKYTPSTIKDARKMKRLLGCAFEGLDSFNGGHPLGASNSSTPFHNA